MVRCKRVFGLGMGYVQALILALPYSVDNLMWQIILDIIDGKEGRYDETTVARAEEAKQEVGHFYLENVKRLKAVVTGIGRLTCMFVIQKVNNKFLLLGITSIEVVFLLFAHSLYIAYGTQKLAWMYLSVIFFQGTRFPFCLNIMAKWTITRRMTSMYSTFEGTRLIMLSIMVILVNHFKKRGHQGVLVHIYCTIAMKVLFCVLWSIFGAADPLQSVFVPMDELTELRKGNPRRIKTKWKNTVPWKKIFTTPILYGCVVYDIGNIWMHDWEFSELIDPFQMFVIKGAVLGLVLYYFFLMSCMIFAFIVDYILKKNITTVNNIRKSTAAISSWGSGVCFLFIGYTLRDNGVANPVWVALFHLMKIANFYNDSTLIVYALSSNYLGFNYAFVSSCAYMSMGLKDRVETALAANGFQWVLYFYAMLTIFSCLSMLLSGNCHPRDFDSFGTIEWKEESFVSFP